MLLHVFSSSIKFRLFNYSTEFVMVLITDEEKYNNPSSYDSCRDIEP